jgi:predicted Zn-dependent protease
VHWWDHFPLRVYFQSNPTIQGQSLIAVSMAGFNTWSDVAGKAVAVQVASPDNADLVVKFENLSSPPQGDQFVGATSWSYNPSTFETIDAEMTLRTWNGMSAGQVVNGLRSTAQHEFGHAIFLSGHSPFEADSMYPFGDINTYNPLTTRDENSLLTTYCGSFQDRTSTHKAGDPLATTRIECPAR